jgi:hypothetical protein
MAESDVKFLFFFPLQTFIIVVNWFLRMSSNGSSITANRKDPPSRIQTIALTANNNNNNKNNNNNNSDEVITSPPLFTAQESAVDDKASSTQTKKYSSVDQIDSPPSALTHRPLARPADGRSLDSLLNSPISDSSVNRLSQSGASTNWIEYLKQSRTKLNGIY